LKKGFFFTVLCRKVKNAKITVSGYKKGSNFKSDNWKIFFSQKYDGFHLSESSSDGRNIAVKKSAKTAVFAPPSTTRVNLKDFVSDRIEFFTLFQHNITIALP